MRQNRNVVHAAAGFYDPSTFYMHVDIDNQGKQVLDINGLTLTDRSTFFHEFIHFLQDISTFAGLNNNLVRSDFLSYAAHEIYNNLTISLPIPPPATGNVAINLEFNDVIRGDYDITDDNSIIVGINSGTKILTVPGAPNNGDVPVALLTLQDTMGRQFEYNFGYAAIMESMAFLMEQFVYAGHYAPSPEYPYNVATKIVESKSSLFSGKPLSLIALCDISLMSNYPGCCFLEFLDELDKRGIDNPHDIYDWFYANHSQFISGFYTNQKCLISVVENALHGYFIADPRNTEYIKINDWIQITLTRARNVRSNSPYYFIDNIALGEAGMNQMYEDFGTPLISDMRHNFYLYNKNIADVPLGHFLSIEQLFNLLADKQIECRPSCFLCASSGINVDRRCCTNPWSRWTDAKLCPFAFMWKSKKLNAYTPC